MRLDRHVILGALILAVITAPLWMAAYVYIAGETVEGVVTRRHEAFEMSDGDAYRHELRIYYQFQPPGAARPRTGEHPVDGALFHRLRPGSRVAIRYTTLPVVEGVIGIGSFLADSTWASRTPGEMYSGSLYEGVAALIAYAWLVFVAYRINFHRIPVFVAESAGRAFFEGIIGLFFFPGHWQIIGYLFIDDFLDFVQLLAGNLFGVRKIEAGALGGNVTAALHHVFAQHVLQSLIHQVGGGVQLDDFGTVVG